MVTPWHLPPLVSITLRDDDNASIMTQTLQQPRVARIAVNDGHTSNICGHKVEGDSGEKLIGKLITESWIIAFIAGKRRRISRLSLGFIIHTLWLKLQVMWYYWSYSELLWQYPQCQVHLTLKRNTNANTLLLFRLFFIRRVLSQNVSQQNDWQKTFNINNCCIIYNVVTTWLWNMNMVVG